jgi:hypothetical protein
MGAKLKSKKGVKNAEFHADFESVEKVVKNAQKKSYKHNFFLVQFFWFFDTFFDFFKKNLLWVILVLFSNFDCKCAGNGSKSRKIFFYECILEFNYATIKGFA